MRLAIWSTTTPRENSTHPEMFRRQLEEVELAERIGIDQIWFFEHLRPLIVTADYRWIESHAWMADFHTCEPLA